MLTDLGKKLLETFQILRKKMSELQIVALIMFKHILR